MSGTAATGDNPAPPFPTSCAIAVGSVLGSGGRLVDTGGTGGPAAPAAAGVGLIGAAPAERKGLWREAGGHRRDRRPSYAGCARVRVDRRVPGGEEGARSAACRGDVAGELS